MLLTQNNSKTNTLILQMGDRGGGREVKGSSLKVSKKNPGSVAAKAKKSTAVVQIEKVKSAHAPIAGEGLFVDTGCVILSRQFDRGATITHVSNIYTNTNMMRVFF